MATISLRAYNKEIDAMIDNGEVKEAVAHCRHILRLYPKHIETYRLLGKAYLESQRFTEAADVLQRVLSSLPDDFISQIGMSMIREDEGNLDAAIYHMERAFEAQPSNTAVQDELKRLYGRRDGVAPAKIRLTRGALVRMYARGDLYQQAIAEARVALVEQPDRVDLEVILARMYFLSGQKMPATEVSSRLVEKLPYCFEANRILADVLPGTSRAEDAEVYMQRVYALDPYLAHLPAGTESSADASEDSVMVEKFEGELEEEAETQPDWAQSVGVQLEQKEEEEVLPDWLTTLDTQEQPPEAAPVEEAAAEQDWGKIEIEPDLEEVAPVGESEAPEEELPDWMRAAGWQSANGEVVDETAAEEQISEVADELAASEGELPEWLQEIAPVEELEALAEQKVEQTSEEDDAWLESILADAEQKASTLSDLELTPPEETAETVEAVDAGAELPLMTNEEELVESEDAVSLLSEAPEIPDWLAGMATVDESAGEPIAAAAETSDDDDWLDIVLPKEEAAAEEDKEVVFPSEEMESPDLTPLSFETGQDFEWLEEETEPFAAEIPVEPSPVVEDFFTEAEKAAPVGTDATQPTRVHSPEFEAAPFAPVFEDLNEVSAPVEKVEPFTAEGAFTEHPEEMIAESAPALLGEDDLSITNQTEPSVEDQSEIAADEYAAMEEESEDLFVPDWLKESLDKEVGEIEYETSEPALEEPIPADTEHAFESESESSVADTFNPEMDDDAAFAWLEALAARQGADEGTLQVPAEERVEETPDWIKSKLEEGEIEPLPPVEETVENLEPEPVGDEAPESAMEEGEPEAATAEEIPDLTPEETTAVETEPASWSEEEFATPIEAAQPETANATYEELPDWLKETLEVEEEVAEEEVESFGEPVIFRAAGEWVPEEVGETPAEIELQDEVELEPEVEILPEEEIASDLEAAPEIPVEGEPAAESVEPTAEPITLAEDTEPEEVPEWLQDLAEEHPRKVTGMLVDVETPPEWLKDLEGEESGLMPEATPYAASTGKTGWLTDEEEPTAPPVEDTSPLRVTPTAVGVAPSSASDLYNAQAALNAQNIEGALEYYNKLIGRGEALEDTIHDLRDAIYRYPIDVSIWQSLGDAYARSNQLQEALDAYTKAEELLR